MKILLLTNMYPSQGGEFWKGIFVKEQVEVLRSLYPELEIDVMHIKGRSTSGGTNLNYLTGMLRYIVARLKCRYDVVWVHHAFCVYLASVWRGASLLYTVHEGVLSGSIKHRIVELATRLSSCALFVNREYFAASVHSHKLFLPSGVDVEQFRCLEKAECRVQLGLDLSKFYVFFPASPQRPEKNSAFAYSFIEKYASWLASENIEFVFGGGIEYELMPTWMNAVDCMVSFSDFESDGMVFKEAMACNLPVITFNVGNAPIYFKSELAGSIISRDHNALKQKITYWKSIGRSNGRDYLLTLGMDKYSVASQLKKIFEEIVDGKN